MSKSSVTLKAFQNWLETQDNSESFAYSDPSNCLLATAVQSILNDKTISCGGYYYRRNFDCAKFPNWMAKISNWLACQPTLYTSIKQVKNFIKSDDFKNNKYI